MSNWRFNIIIVIWCIFFTVFYFTLGEISDKNVIVLLAFPFLMSNLLAFIMGGMLIIDNKITIEQN